jgi:hypothetical protein
MENKKFKIGGHIYSIELVDGEDITKDCGECNKARNVIKIRKDIPQTQIEETLLHEIIHALNGGLDEVTVDGLATGLYQVLKDNKLWRM